MKTFTNFNIREDGYTGGYGWYWNQQEIASIVARAYRDSVHPESLESLEIHVSELSETPLGSNAVGCHDILYSVTALVTSTWNSQSPSADQVYQAFCKTNAQFKVEEIQGGYHFYKAW